MHSGVNILIWVQIFYHGVWVSLWQLSDVPQVIYVCTASSMQFHYGKCLMYYIILWAIFLTNFFFPYNLKAYCIVVLCG